MWRSHDLGRRVPARRAAAIAGVLGLTLAAMAGEARPPAEPAKIRIAVSPTPVARGARTEVALDLAAIDGVKINRYPKIKLTVSAQPGVTRGGDGSLGDDKPPAPDQARDNYFAAPIEALRIPIEVDAAAPAGRHDLDGTLIYFYCVAESGFCAPFRTAVKIPIEVR